ncbi:MAG: dynamin family protein [Cyanobacteriota bacterium]|nr:dynamin family protein [Cyanobacteriota bacterium]
MDTAKINAESVKLLSIITGNKLSKKDIDPPVLFLANLVIILIGVIYADGKVAEEERARLKITLHKFIPPKGNILELTKLMIKGVSKQHLYKKIEAILTLTSPLSPPEKLLLICFGYEMSAADGNIHVREKKYLEIISRKLGIKTKHLQVLEAGFTHQENFTHKAMEEVAYLLNPARFHQLDNIFVKAASEMLNSLLPNYNQNQNKKNRAQQTVVYQRLKEFQTHKQQLQNICSEIYQIVTVSTERDLLPNTLISEVSKILKKLQSQKFRVAMVGEFSQGKSTLLNALLGEEIQPVREIPCSGTVTVLKYGEQKRVICRYKNGNEIEISLAEYQEKATISESAALGNMSQELARSELESIFFEHPDLELCKSGVEIVDSPGLNEHPDRKAITQKLIKDTDAVIFLTNASRSLTQGERELLQSLKLQLNGNQIDLPTDNLFVLVNFLDLVRSEKDRQQIRRSLENFVFGEKPIIAGESRLHFISAQAALDATLEGEENEYLTSFNNFTNSIEKFLTTERGVVEFQQFITKINNLISEGIKGLEQAEKVLDGKVYLPEEAKQKILEKIREASEGDVKILSTTEKLKNKSTKKVAEAWDKWTEGLSDRLYEKINEWDSEHSPLWDKEKVIKDYAEGFTSSLSTELENWGNTEVKKIVVNNLQILSKEVCQNLEVVRMNLQEVDEQINSNLNEQFNLATANIRVDELDINSVIKLEEYDDNGGGLWEGLQLGGLTAGALFMFTGLGILPIIIAGGAVALISSFFGIGGDEEKADMKIKQQVYNVGFQKFQESSEEILDKVCDNIAEVFYTQFKSVSTVIEQAILLYENLLEQQDKAHKETQSQLQVEKAFISAKQQQLTQIQKQLEIILTQISGSL